MKEINLISDTVTRPDAAMLEAMMNAPVGDDVFGEDPTINALEEKLAKIFGKEAALFCPSGTMSNQIAIKTHTKPLDEMICEEDSHVYQYETGGYAFNSGVAVNLIKGEFGKIKAEQVAPAVKSLYDWLPESRLLVIENTTNKGGGSYYTYEEMQAIGKEATANRLKYHLDGARIFNALTESGDSTESVGDLFDSISVCLSKGLGAPVGSVLIGDPEFIRQARRHRKVMGGGMRQAGILAAAGIYALDHNVAKLKDDHRRARAIAAVLNECTFVEDIRPVHTNIIIFDLVPPITAQQFLDKIEAYGVKAVAFGPSTVRFVTHLDYTEDMLERTLECLTKLKI